MIPSQELVHKRPVQYPQHPAVDRGQRTEGRFRVPGNPQLADRNHVPGQPERRGGLGGNRDTAAGEAKHHSVRTPAELGEDGGQEPACLPACGR